jgi:hypothetical protein
MDSEGAALENDTVSIEEDLRPCCSVEGLKERAKIIRRRLDPEKTTRLSALQRAVGRCIGRGHVESVFGGAEPATPDFPEGLSNHQKVELETRREIDVLTSLFPSKPHDEILQFVAKCGLVDWKRTDEARQTVLSRLDNDSRVETRVEKPAAPQERAASAIPKAGDCLLLPGSTT